MDVRCPSKFTDSLRFLFLISAAILLLADGAALVATSASSDADDYEANAFLQQFRRQYLERRSQNFQSRYAANVYRQAPSAHDGDGDNYNREYEPTDQQPQRHFRQRSPWAEQERRNEPYLNVADERSGNGDDDDDEVRNYERGNRVRTPDVRINDNNERSHADSNTEADPIKEQQPPYVLPARTKSDDERFKVETRARARPASSSFNRDSESENPSEKSISSPASDVYFIAVVAGCSAAAIFGVMAAGFCWYKFQKNAKAAAEAEYPAYGITGPNREHISPSSGGDRKLALNANLFHYQHQKQQMLAMEKNNGERQVSTSDLDSEEENEEGDYTVYECPGLAPTGEMEVKNPLFQDEPTPASPLASGRPPLNSGTSEEESSK